MAIELYLSLHTSSKGNERVICNVVNKNDNPSSLSRFFTYDPSNLQTTAEEIAAFLYKTGNIFSQNVFSVGNLPGEEYRPIPNSLLESIASLSDEQNKKDKTNPTHH